MASIKNAVALFASVVAAATIPTNDGFPNSTPDQLQLIGQQAGGLLPNGPLPSKLGANSVVAFQLIAAQETFETAYFSSLLKNITDGGPGFENDSGHPKEELEKIFKVIVAQEELHAAGARAILKNVKAFIPDPCQYQFPVTNLRDGVLLAETFTAAVLGALQGANVIFAQDGELPVVQLVSSIIGQEAEQNGFYRVLLDQVPSESPFLTPVPPAFAWSALQLFIKPNSCPFPLSKIKLPILPSITTNGGPIAVLEAQDQVLKFSTDLSKAPNGQEYLKNKGKGLTFTYTTGQQLPITVPISKVSVSGTTLKFEAEFPFKKNVMQGFSHGALTKGKGFQNVTETGNAAIAGPALIQVKNQL